MLQDSTYMMEKKKSQRQKLNERLPGAGGMGEWGVIVYGFRVSVWTDEKVQEKDSWWLYNIVNILNGTELYLKMV